jgi:hypothetical protein
MVDFILSTITVWAELNGVEIIIEEKGPRNDVAEKFEITRTGENDSWDLCRLKGRRIVVSLTAGQYKFENFVAE